MRLAFWSFLFTMGFVWGCSRDKAPATTSAPPEAGNSGPESRVVILRPDSPQLSRIHIRPVETAEVPLDEVVAPGKIEVNPNRISRVAMPVPGRVRQVLVRLGDSIKEGEILFTVDSPEAGSALSAYRQSQAAVGRSQASLMKAEADLGRARDLFENRAIAQKEVISAENALAQSKADLEQAQASREETERRLRILGLTPGNGNQEVVVRAPIPGKLLEINVAPGEYRNDTSASLMTIADLSTVWMVSEVPETSIRLVTKGEKIEIELSAYPGETFSARVTRIGDVVDAQTRTVKVQAELRNPDARFLPEMFGRIRHEETFRRVPVVPVGAILQGNGKNLVFVEQNSGTFQEVEVAVGRRFGNQIPILSGLKAGDRVVVDGVMLLKSS